MKVFTVGLDQKAPPAADAAVIKDGTDTLPAKSGADSPPPGYHFPSLPTLPPVPPTLVVRKSRGYKGVLLVMLSVFIMAVFALTLSEIAYSRHREENYFRLRWAELKHRMGYGGPRRHGSYEQPPTGYPWGDFWGRSRFGGGSGGGGGDRIFSLSKSHQMETAPDVSLPATTTTTTTEEPSTAAVGSSESKFIFEPFPQRPTQQVFPFPPPQFMTPIGSGGSADSLRDARLQFLRTILQRIKQRAESMGFDGTMQVSVIEVEPQTGTDDDGKPNAPLLTNHFTSTSTIGKGLPNGGQAGNGGMQAPQWPQQAPFPLRPPSQLLNGLFFPPPPPPPRPSFLDPKSSAFLDGFGEIHQPSLFQQNQFIAEREQREREQQRSQPWAQQQSSGPESQPDSQQSISDFGESPNPFFRSQFGGPGSGMMGGFQPPHIQLTRPPPSAFDRWTQPSMNAPPPAPVVPSNENPNEPPPPPPHLPVTLVNVDSSSPASAGPASGSVVVSAPSSGSAASGGSASSSANPSQEVVGELYGRKFGRLLQDIIANRIHGFQQLNSHSQDQVGGAKAPSPVVMN